MKDKINVRMCKIEDIATVTRIRIDAWRGAFTGIINQQTLDEFDYQSEAKTAADEFETRNTANNLCIAETANKIIGFCIFDAARAISIPKGESKLGEIRAFYVDPVNQRCGAGRTIFDFVAQKLNERGFDKMVIWTLDGNKIGINFYEKIGGALCGTREREIRGHDYTEIGYLFSIKP